MAIAILPGFLAQFQEIAPQINLKLFVNRHEPVVDALKNGRVEIALLKESFINPEALSTFNYKVIHSGHCYVYESINRQKNMPIDKCIFAGPSQEEFLLKKSYKKYYDKELSTQMDVRSWEVLVNFVIANVGVGLIPDYLVQVPHRQSLLRKSKLRYDPMPYNLCAVFLKNEKLSKNAELFLKCINNQSELSG